MLHHTKNAETLCIDFPNGMLFCQERIDFGSGKASRSVGVRMTRSVSLTEIGTEAGRVLGKPEFFTFRPPKT
ncbi:hypothetical protein, partial [Pseudomonas fluorescens]|uniref:hypothetical protein n=3 Tax=Pseudomonas TaxID=286 RepID=UPI001C81EA6D